MDRDKELHDLIPGLNTELEEINGVIRLPAAEWEVHGRC